MHERRTRAVPRGRRRRRRSRLAALAGALGLALAAAACSGGGGNPGGVASLSGSVTTTTTTAAAGGGGKGRTPQQERQAALDFAKCMREHGFNQPDPQFSGGAIIQQGPAGVDRNDPRLKATEQACQHFLPNGGQASPPSTEQRQRLLQFARCMREHGIDMPDPSPNGELRVTGRRGDPRLETAQRACQQRLGNQGPDQGSK
jgi:hypothetical protein